MSLLQSVDLYCPYCGEAIELVVDCSLAEQSYGEDCPVCCQPMVLDVVVDDDRVARIDARREDD